MLINTIVFVEGDYFGDKTTNFNRDDVRIRVYCNFRAKNSNSARLCALR